MERKRLQSIDMLRGLVMVIMALDHVRDMMTAPQPGIMDFSGAQAPLFFTRWITHICAPTFVFLAGVSAFLYGARGRSTGDLSRFLLTRGLWLIVVEFTLVGFGWNFNLGTHYFVVAQVIWAIGVSMVVLSALVWMPRSVVGVIGAMLILGHNLLDPIQPAPQAASALWSILHIQGPVDIGVTRLFVAYPLIPWVGVMALGYSIGGMFVADDPSRPRRLILTGIVLTVAFVVLRAAHLYGEPDGWQSGTTFVHTLIDFLNTTKYPPSLQYLLMTLGPATILLGLFENARGVFADALVIVGRVPFFFYVVHLYVIHAVAIGVGLFQGYSIQEIAVGFIFLPKDFGLSLGWVYLAWGAIVLSLYPLCRWFARVKKSRNDWWLSYV